MEKTNVILSDKFLKQLKDFKMFLHLKSPCQKGFKGSLRTISKDLHVLQDSAGNDVCGILDGETFYNALMETDVAHLFARSSANSN